MLDTRLRITVFSGFPRCGRPAGEKGTVGCWAKTAGTGNSFTTKPPKLSQSLVFAYSLCATALAMSMVVDFPPMS